MATGTFPDIPTGTETGVAGRGGRSYLWPNSGRLERGNPGSPIHFSQAGVAS